MGKHSLKPKSKGKAYKAKKKGVVYVAARLRKYYPSRYEDVASSRARAKELISEVKGSDLKVTWSNARKAERGILEKPLVAPEYVVEKEPKIDLPVELQQPVAFFDDAILSNGLKKLPAETLLRADFFDKDVVCGFEIDYYSAYFRSISRVLDAKRPVKSSDNIFRYVFLPPFRENGNLVVTTYLIDADGDRVDLDFIADVDVVDEQDLRSMVLKRQEKEADQYIEELRGKDKEQKQVDLPTTKEQIQLEKLKAKTAATSLKIEKASLLNKLMSEGKSFEQALKLLKKAGL